MSGQAVSHDFSIDQFISGVGTQAPGWFGKLAMLGDFASRRLPQPFVDACDAWLSKGMDASKTRLGAQFLDVYLTGPIWRFAWAPGVIDSEWWAGVLMPSVDKVGRYFPLVVAQTAHDLPETLEGIQALDGWYRHLSAAALGTLGAGATVEDFESALARAPSWQAERHSVEPAATAMPGRLRYTYAGAASLPQWIDGLVVAEAMRRYTGHSLWWPDHASAPDDSLSVAPGLPPPDCFSELLEGRW
ncbi:type VI secretion system-associated protein TagF [Rhizobacter sp. OV335]|jgi:type VI secretion system protein ImpM|uniref:type VI secretion system-associated protein TagF n=1 Tax=Rhizobacter sp. OV335 TaxID=1500264 RepID=UPI0009235551|nr:type VI secretion system-associated protein TagF [Rhizobacter sp. OV335]SHN36621.1 type VI secretion system protein ImpM [Rhizobacter sp. OV335]